MAALMLHGGGCENTGIVCVCNFQGVKHTPNMYQMTVWFSIVQVQVQGFFAPPAGSASVRPLVVGTMTSVGIMRISALKSRRIEKGFLQGPR